MLNQLLSYAIEETKHLKHDEIFLIKDLFKGYEWSRIERSKRLKLGILFLNTVESDPSIDVVPIEKTSSHQQKYKKL